MKNKIKKKKKKKTVNDYQKDFDLNEKLNLLSKEELDKTEKKRDDEYYEQNNIKVADKNFQYDVRKDLEEIIKNQKEKIIKLSKELEEYKKDNRKGIYIIREDKTVKISKNLITINDEFVILIKCEPLRYYNSYYYIINYEIDKLKSKEIYIDNKKIEEDKYKIKDKYYLIFNFENTFNDETRILKVIYEIQNEFLYYSSYQLYMNEKDVLMKYEITVDDDIQIDDVTNEYFKKEKGGKLVLFEGKTTNEIIVKSGSLVFFKKNKLSNL